jgi:hypothetical protein
LASLAVYERRALLARSDTMEARRMADRSIAESRVLMTAADAAMTCRGDTAEPLARALHRRPAPLRDARADHEPTGAERIQSVRIYVFKSEARENLRAFAGDAAGSRLPQQHGPWTAIGVIRPDADPPHKFSRVSIERTIDDDGFQLWRLRIPAKATAGSA